MKKLACIIFIMALLAGCFAGCQQEKTDTTVVTTQPEEGCVRYDFVQWSIDQQVHTYATVSQATGNTDLFLKLYDDGTAKMCIDTQIREMQYADGTIWLVEDPNNKMILTLAANIATITDGAYVFRFAAKV